MTHTPIRAGVRLMWLESGSSADKPLDIEEGQTTGHSDQPRTFRHLYTSTEPFSTGTNDHSFRANEIPRAFGGYPVLGD